MSGNVIVDCRCELLLMLMGMNQYSTAVPFGRRRPTNPTAEIFKKILQTIRFTSICHQQTHLNPSSQVLYLCKVFPFLEFHFRSVSLISIAACILWHLAVSPRPPRQEIVRQVYKESQFLIQRLFIIPASLN